LKKAIGKLLNPAIRSRKIVRIVLKKIKEWSLICA